MNTVIMFHTLTQRDTLLHNLLNFRLLVTMIIVFQTRFICMKIVSKGYRRSKEKEKEIERD